ncbi:hypothetical protein EV363DRAFT_1367197 [Boletus edulis]|nr:hypothetical protein EV363DRAFT_1367197 [Boletus edulis]
MDCDAVSAMSSDKARRRSLMSLVFAPPPRRSSSPHCSSSPVSAHPPTTPCLHSNSGASQLTSLGSGAREPDCRADAPARRSHPPSQLTPHRQVPIVIPVALHDVALVVLTAEYVFSPTRVEEDVQSGGQTRLPGRQGAFSKRHWHPQIGDHIKFLSYRSKISRSRLSRGQRTWNTWRFRACVKKSIIL